MMLFQLVVYMITFLTTIRCENETCNAFSTLLWFGMVKLGIKHMYFIWQGSITIFSVEFTNT